MHTFTVNLGNLTYELHPVPFTRIDDLVLPKTGTSCVDERTNYVSPAVFGGDWGVFITTVISLASHNLISMDYKNIKELLSDVIQGYKRYNLMFYTHTDNHGHNSPNHIGCGFTKVALNTIKDTMPELSGSLHRLYTEITTQQITYANLMLDELSGEHNASLVTIVEETKGYTPQTVAVKRQVTAIQNGVIYNLFTFVYNPHTEAHIIRFILSNLTKQLTSIKTEEAFSLVSKTANKLNRATLEQLSANAEYSIDTNNYSIKPLNNTVRVKDLPVIRLGI